MIARRKKRETSGLNAKSENTGSCRVPPWSPQLGPQTDAIAANWCPELFYGGAAGGGKSDFLLGDYLQDVETYAEAWRGVLFRRTFPELEELIARSLEMYPQTGGEWFEQKRLWKWPNGATLKMRYCETDRDVTRYQGHQYTWIGWDELTQWASLFCYRYLRSRLRSAHKVDTKRMRGAANPGGAGHQAVRSYFIDPAPGGYVPILDADTGQERIFIPARLEHNEILLRNDPGYEGRLRGVGSETLVKALLHGDWNVVDGAFFNEWLSARHVVRPFTIPEGWVRFASMDWGSAKPFSVGWWAVVSDDYPTPTGVLPRGCLVRYREWYGMKPGEPNIGLKLHAGEVAEGIKKRETGEKVSYRVIDPAAFAENGGPSIAETMRKAGVFFRPADNSRVAKHGAIGGWDQLRGRLAGDGDGNPMVAFFSTCVDSIRTIPTLQHDRSRPEDLGTTAEDHAADDVRYAVMSRPWNRPLAKPSEKRETGYSSTREETDSWR